MLAKPCYADVTKKSVVSSRDGAGCDSNEFDCDCGSGVDGESGAS